MAGRFKMKAAAPVRKVTAGALGGALVTVLVWYLNTFVLEPDKQITGEVAAALTTIVTFLVGYFVPPSAKDEIVAA